MTLKPKLYIMTYRSYMYAWIYYCTHQYLLIFFETKKLKIPSKFDFRFGFSDFDKIFFAMSSKYGKLFMVFFLRFLYCLFIEVIFDGSCLKKNMTHQKLEKSVFEVKHTWTF
jgi:hypothetical protein